MTNKVEVDKELLASVGQVIMLLHNLIESGNQPYIQTRNTLHAARELHKLTQAACDAKLGEAPPVVVGPPRVLTIEEKIALEDQLAAYDAISDVWVKAREEEEAYIRRYEEAKIRARHEAP